MNRIVTGLQVDKDGISPGLAIETMDSWTPSASVTDASMPWPEAVADVPRRERPGCAFAGCTAGWSKLWKRSNRPMFEGEWGCSRACIRALVEASLKREMEGADGVDVAEEHRHRMPLGLVLLAQGLVTRTQLQQALEAQRTAGRGRIGEWLVEACGVQETKVTRGLGVQWQCPVLGLAGFDATKMALAMPLALRDLCQVVPLRVAGGRILYAAFDEKVDAAAAFALERMSGLTVESGLVRGAEFARATASLSGCAAVKCLEDSVADRTELVDRAVSALLTLQPVASRLVRLRDRYWLRLWLERGAIGKDGMLPGTGEDVVDLLFRVRREGTASRLS